MEKILVVDDRVDMLEYLTDLLGQSGHKVIACGDAASAIATIERRGAEIGMGIVDLDLGCGGDDGLKLLSQIKALRHDLPVIILTARAGARAIAQAMKLGAADFLEKDAQLPGNLTARIKKAAEFLKLVRENRRLAQEVDSLRRQTEYYSELAGLTQRLVGASRALRRCMAEAQAVARLNGPVLIIGERGTGKKLIARYIHQKSDRAAGPFVSVNCAASSGSCQENEILGYGKGAFTGAGGRKPGLLELADGGTLFLDAITNISRNLQEALLSVIEHQHFERRGGGEKVEVRARIIAATDSGLDALFERGAVSRDIYQRLAVKVVKAPPLRERKEDIGPLVEFFLDEIYRETTSLTRCRFTPAAVKRLQELPWPGNVRQLRNFVERKALESAGGDIGADQLGLEDNGSGLTGETLAEKVEYFESCLVRQALASSRGNQRAAARVLGVTYDRFRRFCKKFALKSKD